jgi:hypothetical protein
LIVVVIVVIAGLYGSAVYFVNQMTLHRVEKADYTPEKLSLAAETVALTSSDGVPLKGWWVPADAPRGIVILLHGMDGMDASSLLPQAQFLHEVGYSAFVLDMRAHGRSGGRRIGLAFKEPRDVAAALDWIKTRPDLAGKPVALLGLSMGGAVAIRTAAARPDVTAVISVSAYSSVDRMLAQGMKWMGMPSVVAEAFVPFMRLGMLTVFGVWPATASPLHDIPRVSPRPILIAHGTADRQVSVENAYLLKRAAGATARLWIVDGADHLIFTETGNGQGSADVAYREHVLQFLNEVMR